MSRSGLGEAISENQDLSVEECKEESHRERSTRQQDEPLEGPGEEGWYLY